VKYYLISFQWTKAKLLKLPPPFHTVLILTVLVDIAGPSLTSTNTEKMNLYTMHTPFTSITDHTALYSEITE